MLAELGLVAGGFPVEQLCKSGACRINYVFFCVGEHSFQVVFSNKVICIGCYRRYIFVFRTPDEYRLAAIENPLPAYKPAQGAVSFLRGLISYAQRLLCVGKALAAEGEVGAVVAGDKPGGVFGTAIFLWTQTRENHFLTSYIADSAFGNQ